MYFCPAISCSAFSCPTISCPANILPFDPSFLCPSFSAPRVTTTYTCSLPAHMRRHWRPLCVTNNNNNNNTNTNNSLSEETQGKYHSIRPRCYRCVTTCHCSCRCVISSSSSPCIHNASAMSDSRSQNDHAAFSGCVKCGIDPTDVTFIPSPRTTVRRPCTMCRLADSVKVALLTIEPA